MHGDFYFSENIRAGSDVIGGRIFGDVSSATIEDVSGNYDDDRIKPILDSFRGRLVELEAKPVEPGDTITIITNLGGNLYGFKSEFSEPSSVLNVLFPTGKILDPNGTFWVEIYGMPWISYEGIPSYLGADRGIQFHMLNEQWPTGARGRGLFQLVDSTPLSGVTPIVVDQVVTPKTAPSEALFGSILEMK